MEKKVKAIVIKSSDYKEKDKHIVLFSLEEGKIFATLRGVKSPNAKLKFAKELFLFGEFVLAGETVTSCEVIDTFYDIVKDVDRYYEGANILTALNIVVGEEPNAQLFLETLKCLKSLAYESLPKGYVLSKFLISIFGSLGYRLSLQRCASCGGDFAIKRFFNFNTGEIVCLNCSSYDCVEISKLAYATMRHLAETPYEKLSTLKLNARGLDEALGLLLKNFEFRFSKSLSVI